MEPRGKSGASARPSRKVLGVVGEPMSGVSYVRFVQPFEHLRRHGYELSTLGSSLELLRGPLGYEPSTTLLDGVSHLIFPQMVASPTLADGSRVRLVEPLCEEARRRGIKIVYSVDDYLIELDEANPAYDVIQDSIENLQTILDHADAIVATTDVLRDSMAEFGRPVHVLPNAIDPSCWQPRPRSSGELRVGWCGSSSHVEDMRMLVPAIREAQRRTPFVFWIHGLTDMTIANQVRQARRNRKSFTPAQRETARSFIELSKELRSIEYRHTPFGDMDGYFGRLPAMDLDIGLCPLLDTRFNRHKSALKFYEYAAAGTMTVASAVPPYAGEVSVAVENDPRAWADAVELYLNDADARETELAKQREYVLRERNIETLSDAWATALEEVLAGGPAVRETAGAR